MLHLLLVLVALLVIGAIVWWLLQQTALPYPFRLVAVLIVALIAIVLVLQVVGGTGGLTLGRGSWCG